MRNRQIRSQQNKIFESTINLECRIQVACLAGQIQWINAFLTTPNNPNFIQILRVGYPLTDVCFTDFSDNMNPNMNANMGMNPRMPMNPNMNSQMGQNWPNQNRMPFPNMQQNIRHTIRNNIHASSNMMPGRHPNYPNGYPNGSGFSVRLSVFRKSLILHFFWTGLIFGSQVCRQK